MSRPPELYGNHRQERERRELRATDEAKDASSDEDIQPGAVSVTVSEPRGPSAIDEPSFIVAELAEPSFIVAELAEPYQEDEELRRRCQEHEQTAEELRRKYLELEQNISEAVTGTVIVEKSGGGDHDQTAASSKFGRRFWIGAALALLLVIGVIIGVTIPWTTNSPKACTRLDCLAEILLQHEVLGAEALQDDSSPQFNALRWLANEDTAVLDLDSTPTVILVERYVLAVFYYATSGGGWRDQRNFLSASSLCEWNNEEGGVDCDGDGLVVSLFLGKSKHEEIIVLISKFLICVRKNVTLCSHFLDILFGQILIN
jgi:hypothetical protein